MDFEWICHTVSDEVLLILCFRVPDSPGLWFILVVRTWHAHRFQAPGSDWTKNIPSLSWPNLWVVVLTSGHACLRRNFTWFWLIMNITFWLMQMTNSLILIYYCILMCYIGISTLWKKSNNFPLLFPHKLIWKPFCYLFVVAAITFSVLLLLRPLSLRSVYLVLSDSDTVQIFFLLLLW